MQFECLFFVQQLRQLVNNFLTSLREDLIGALSGGVLCTRLEGEGRSEDGVSGIDSRSDICVVVQSEHLCQVVQWDRLLDEVDVGLTITIRGNVVDTTRAQLVILCLNHVHVVVVCEHR